MASLNDKIEAEYENIDRLIFELPQKERLPFFQPRLCT